MRALAGLDVTHAEVARHGNRADVEAEFTHQPAAAVLLGNATLAGRVRAQRESALAVEDVEMVGDAAEVRHHPGARRAGHAFQADLVDQVGGNHRGAIGKVGHD